MKSSLQPLARFRYDHFATGTFVSSMAGAWDDLVIEVSDPAKPFSINASWESRNYVN